MPDTDKKVGRTWADLIGSMSVRLVSWAFIAFVAVFLVFSGVAFYAWYSNQTLVLAGYEFGVSSIRSGAVIAYDLSECPNGWSNFEEATGRFILGAGEISLASAKFDEAGNLLVPRSYRAIGGNQEVALTVDQMPAHRHGIPLVAGNTAFDHEGSGSNVPYFDYRSRLDVTLDIVIETPQFGVGPTGKSKPHQIIPPFVALNICKRD